jgi:hypothetical protein
MVHTDHPPPSAAGSGRQIHRRLAAVTADLKNGTEVSVVARQVMQSQSLLVIEETLALERHGVCIRVHAMVPSHIVSLSHQLPPS